MRKPRKVALQSMVSAFGRRGLENNGAQRPRIGRGARLGWQLPIGELLCP